MTQRRATGEVGKYIISAVILGAAVLGMFGLIASREKTESQDPDVLVPVVRTFPAELFEGQLDLEVSGLVVPYREINLSAQVAGRVARKTDACQAGTYVEFDPDSDWSDLIVIDQRDYQLEIDRLKSELAQADVFLRELESEKVGTEKNMELADRDLVIAQREYDRLRGLGQAVSKSEVDQAERAKITAEKARTGFENNLSVLEARKARLEAAKELAAAQLKKAELNFDRTVIKAPTDGVVVEELVEEGDFVQIGTPLLVFEDTSKAEVICNLRIDQVDWILEHQMDPVLSSTGGRAAAYQLPPTNVTITANVGGQQVTWDGVLQRFDGIGLDEVSKTIPCRVEVAEPLRDTPTGPKALVRGMYVRVRIEIDAGPMAGRGKRFVQFPAEAVQPGNKVWTVQDGKLELKDVQIVDYQQATGTDSESMVVVKLDDQIAVGEKIVVTPPAQPTEDGTVKEES